MIQANSPKKSVGDPNLVYNEMKPAWVRARAFASGEREVKKLDRTIDTIRYTNILLPFSPTMSQEQYDFYRSEAELPGITSQFAKMLSGGLLRKNPTLVFTDKVPKEAKSWINENFSVDDQPLVSFMAPAVYEEVVTSRPWIRLDIPSNLAEDESVIPYPVMHKPETVINWRYSQTKLTLLIIKGYEEVEVAEGYHSEYREVCHVHRINSDNQYEVLVYKRPHSEKTVADTKIPVTQPGVTPQGFVLVGSPTIFMINGNTLDYIPAWPFNGDQDVNEPLLESIIDKEAAIYNKMSRRNHLLYGAATFTPYVASDMTDEEFKTLVQAGLGSWLKIAPDDKIGTLATPTDAIADMEKSIAAGIEELARLGVRMLAPEKQQSGVALVLRNASQSAQIGSLNTKVSQVMRTVIRIMIEWRYNIVLEPEDVLFELSKDFTFLPIGADWLKLATQWYEAGLIPRSVWIALLAQNDMLPPDYSDEEGQKAIKEDRVTLGVANETLIA